MKKIGLKNNALFLFEAMEGDTLGGTTGGVFHNKIIHLNKIQFDKFKKLIEFFGFCPNKSLAKGTPENGVDFSCSLEK